MTIHTLNIIKISEEMVRGIILEQEAEDLPKMVQDIWEVKIKEVPYMVSHYDNIRLAESHIENTDFGRAKKFSSKALKAAQQLEVEEA